MPFRKTRRVRRAATKRPQRKTGRRVRRRGFRGKRSGFPMQMKTLTLSYKNHLGYAKLNYVDAVTLSTAASNSAEYAFRVNSIFDPNYTGSGHQPYFHDTLASIWARYRVLGCKVKVLFHPTNANNGATLYIRAADDAAVSTTNTTSLLYESRQCQAIKDIRPYVTAVGDAPQLTLSTYISTKKYMFGKDWDSYSAAFGANPADSIFFIVGQCTDGATSQSFTAHVNITYYVELRGRVLVGAS